MKNGLVTPRTTFGLNTEEVQTGVRTAGGLYRRCAGFGDSRRLCSGGVLLELAVMDGEIRTEVAAELQRTDGPDGTEQTSEAAVPEQ